MNRFTVVCSLLVGALAGCDTLFPGPGGSHSGTLTGLGPDGGVCEKDPQTIKNVMLAPPICNATNPCPCGTFCSSQTGGNCVADCVDDSWCAPGHFCSGYGQCLAGSADGGAGDGPGPNTDPSCPRNEALLDSLHVMRRSCEFDDICPFGSFCDHVQESCDWQCRTDTQCAGMNTPGHTFVCGCLGKCVEVAAPRVPATKVLPSLEVTPKQFTFPRPQTITEPVWGNNTNLRFVSLVVVSPFVTTSGSSITGPTVKITANPGPGLMVQCPGAPSPSAMPCSFTVDPATLRNVNGTYRSDAVQLTLAPSPGAPTATSWDLRLSSDDLSSMPTGVSLRYAETVKVPIGPTIQGIDSPPAGFVGTGNVVMGTATGATLTIAVKARERDGYLVLFDETQQLSPSGKLILNVAIDDSARIQTFLNPELRNDMALQDSLTGYSLQMVVSKSLQVDTASGAISGTFQRAIFTEWGLTGSPPAGPFNATTTASLSLSPSTSTAVGTCEISSDCPQGSTCDFGTGFCSTLPPHRYNPSGRDGVADGDLMHHKRITGWGPHFARTFQSDETDNRGLLGIYAPSSYQQVNGFSVQLRGPLPIVSGEPRADILAYDGSVLASNVVPQMVPLLTQHDGTSPQAVSALLKSCVADLSKDRTIPLESTYQPDSEAFDYGVGCINLGRLVFALRDRRTFQRAIQGWLDVHSFVMREGLEEAHLSEATAGIPGTIDPTNPPLALEQLLGVGESGLGLLLDINVGMFGSFFSNRTEDLVPNVDYRPNGLVQRFCSIDADCNISNGTPTMTCDTFAHVCQIRPFTALPQHEQPLGVPTKVLEAATAYLKVMDAYLARIARQTYGQPGEASPSTSRQAAIARFGTGMRLVLWAEQLAVAINIKAACTSNPANSSETCDAIAARFAAVRDEMNLTRQRVAADAEAIRTGRNPFNIPEDDIPLFFGDTSGKNSQYFAASDYLLNGWALPAVNQAASYLDAARTSWLSQLQAKAQDELNVHNRDQEINQLMSKYGAPILDACGGVKGSIPGGFKDLESAEVVPYFLPNPASFDPSSCYVEQSCIGNEGVDGNRALRTVLKEAWLNPDGTFINTIDDPMTRQVESKATMFVRSEICKQTFTISQGKVGYDYRQFLERICPADNDWIWSNDDPPYPRCRVSRLGDGNFYFTNGGDVVPVAALFGPVRRSDVTGPNRFYANAFPPPSGTGEFAYPYHETRTDTQTDRWGPPPIHLQTLAETFETSAADFCSMGNYRTFSGHVFLHLFNDYPRPDRALLPARCYRGGLGVIRFEMESALQRAKMARDTLVAGQKGADDQFELCSAKDAHFRAVQGAVDNYNWLKHYYHVEAAAVAVFHLDFGGFLEESVMSDMFGFSRSDEAERIRQMEDAFAHEEDIQACWNTFRAQRRALTAAVDQIHIAAADLNAQSGRFKALQAQIRASLNEGISVYKKEKDSPLSSLANVFWVNEKVEEYKKQFEWSRRLAFLAMRAVEFEFQQSLPFRSKIVAATTPAQLQDVVLGLQQEQAARTINRRRPEEASIVVSLRDDVLSIADRSGDPAGERNWTAADRFRSRLWEDRYAIRDDKGEYLGQGIPFTLAPTGVLETRCGERVWRATATLQGDGIESSAPGASVLLLKRNTFSSQYCSGKSPPTTTSTGAAGAGPPMQVGVVHTSAQLFRPGANVDLSDANQFTAALLYPWFNIRKTDFYKTGFRDGASEELAGRGLYGDYILLFPKQVLDNGMALDKVEDVLLRLDYLSVDNLSK